MNSPGRTKSAPGHSITVVQRTSRSDKPLAPPRTRASVSTGAASTSCTVTGMPRHSRGSGRRVSAVDRDRGARYVGGLVRGEKGDGRSYLLRRSESALGDRALDLALERRGVLLVLNPCMDQRRKGRSRSDRVNADASRNPTRRLRRVSKRVAHPLAALYKDISGTPIDARRER